MLNLLIFISFCYSERVHNKREFNRGKSKTLLWISNNHPLSWTLNNINFYLSTFPAKINDTNFQNKEKTVFWGHFCPKGIFPKNYGYVQLQGSASKRRRKKMNKFLKDELMLDLSMKRDLRAFSKLRQRRKNNHLSSTFKLQLHKGFKVSRRPCLNLCSFKWMKRRRNLVRHLTPSGSFTLNIHARPYKREKFVFENCSWLRVLFLAHSDREFGKKEYLRQSVLQLEKVSVSYVCYKSFH